LLLVIDNGSVYSKTLIEFLLSEEISLSSFHSSVFNLTELKNYDSIILSGRRKNDTKMNMINSKIIKHCISKNKPLLGICYGAEILALTLGGTIKRIDYPLKDKEDIEILKPNPLSEGRLHVFESHHFEISKLPKSFTHLGRSKSCRYEIIQLEHQNIYGTQFHPEMTQDGQQLIKRFSKL
jgi:GMP synthase (glutamine-hydrolysing)